MIRALRRKFVLITMLLVSVVLLAVFAGICLFFRNIQRTEGQRALEMAMDRHKAEQSPSFRLGGPPPEGFRHDPVFVVTVDADGRGRLLFSDNVEVDTDEIQELVSQVLAGGESQGQLHEYGLRYLVREREGQYNIAFLAQFAEKEQMGRIVTVTALAIAGAFLVFLVTSTLLARWALRPVEKAWERQRQFVADASHELKTPLTVILANTGILKNHPEDSVATQMPWVDNTEAEAKRMKGLVDDLLFLAKGDDPAGRASFTRVNFSDLAATAALSFEAVAFEAGMELTMELGLQIEVQGNEAQLKQLLGILLDNAVKYGQKGTAVRLSLQSRAGQAELAVFASGPAIPGEVQKHLFERFYRADASRSSEGYGLGLAIAKTIAEAHRGKIGAESGEGGNTFTVCLPLAGEAHQKP